MKKNLSDYVALSKARIPPELCALTVKELESSSEWQRHTFSGYENGNLVEFTSERDPLRHPGILPTVIPELMDIYWSVIHEYVTKTAGFSWFPSWQGFDPLKFVQYSLDTEMRKHCDHIHSMFDGEKKGIPILTVIGLLNDDFSGGELALFDDEVINFERGDLLVFPSVFLFPHVVKPITAGKRYSASTWVY
jgi:hypothetical protein